MLHYFLIEKDFFFFWWGKKTSFNTQFTRTWNEQRFNPTLCYHCGDFSYTLHWRSRSFPSIWCTGWPMFLQFWLFPIETVCNGFVMSVLSLPLLPVFVPGFRQSSASPSSLPAPHCIPSCSAPLCPHLVHSVETRTLACGFPWGLYFSPWCYLSRILTCPVCNLFKHTIHILPQWGLVKGPAW